MTKRGGTRNICLLSLILAASCAFTAGPALASSTPADLLTDWPKFHFDLGNTGYNPYETTISPSNVSQLHEIWTFVYPGPLSSPVESRGGLFVGGPGGKKKSIFRLDATTGAAVWSDGFGHRRVGVLYPPTVSADTVYVPNNRGEASDSSSVLALDAGTGDVHWSQSTVGNNLSPSVTGGVVYISSSLDRIYALDASTGAILWTALQGRNGLTPTAYADGLLYVASGNGHLYALDASTGGIEWSFEISGPINPAPVVANGTVYLASDKIYAFDALSGALRWMVPTGGFSETTPAVANGIVYVSLYDGNLYALDASTGATIWHTDSGDFFFSPPAAANGVVYIGSEQTGIHAFDASTGDELWSFFTGLYSRGDPVIVNGMLYITVSSAVFAFGL